MGSLMTHEIVMKYHNKDEEEDKKKKTITLKSSTLEEEDDEELSDSELEDIALLTKSYKKYLRFKKRNNLKKNSNGNFSGEKKGNDYITCFEREDSWT